MQDTSPTEIAHDGADLGQHMWGQSRIQYLLHVFVALSPYVLISMLCLMLPGRGSGQQCDPPTWDPANDRHSFDMWTRDLHAWTVLVSDRMDSSQQAAVVGLSRRGAAAEMYRAMTTQERTVGGIVEGVQVQPLTYLLIHLASRLAPFGRRATTDGAK